MSVWRVALHVVDRTEIAGVDGWHRRGIDGSPDCEDGRKVGLKGLAQSEDTGHFMVTRHVILLVTAD